ncbi:MAG: hypothetical protein QXL16_02045 [Candidatus Micrarchaeaceae archaeon]
MRCSQCYREIEPGTGIMYVRRNSSVRYFCSNRCFKLSVKIGKKPMPKNKETKKQLVA